MSRLSRNHWQLLTALSEVGTLSRAADALFITQSAATQRLREAERRLGVALAERAGKSLRLNAAGRRIAAAGRELEKRLSAAESDAVWLGRNAGERIRVVQSDYDNPDWLVAFARLLRDAGVETDVELLRGEPDGGLRSLAGGDADVALVPTRQTYPGVTAIPAFEDRLVALVPPGDRLAKLDAVSPDDLAARTYFTYGDMPESGFEFERFFRPAGVYPEKIVRIESTETIVSLVEAGLGVSVLARSTTATAATGGRVNQVNLAGAPIDITWHLLVSSAIASDAVSTAVEHLRLLLSGD
jgi:LysR family transcriptional regulator for metE and metH